MKRNYQNPSPKLSSTLPILEHKQSILSLITSSAVSIIQAETGSGKSTQIPQYILERYPSSKIVVSQPRRMAAIAVARRVASELNTDIGSAVGYHIKGEAMISRNTQITYMTAGVLIQIISHIKISEPLPWEYVIMDEVHERSIEMDFLLVLFKYFLAKGKKFKLVLMSATLQKILAGYFSDSSILSLKNKNFALCGEEIEEEIDWTIEEDEWKSSDPRKNEFYKSSTTKIKNFIDVPDALRIFSSDSRQYKILINYLQESLRLANSESVIADLTSRNKDSSIISPQFLENAFQISSDPDEIDQVLYLVAARIILYHKLNTRSSGTFLVFLPGIQEISQMYEVFQEVFSDNFEELDVLMLHSSIPEKEHTKVLRPPREGTRRVILSTNIAESSITLPDVTFVIDFCFSREMCFNSATMTENLVLVWAAQATMQQRAGRAGRVSEGIVYRLLPLDFFKILHEYPTPEMQRSCLDKVILKLKLMDFSDPKLILAETIEPPGYQEICKTEQYLKSMGAIDGRGKISRLGIIFTDMPYDIRISRLCIFSILFNCVEEAFICAAIIALEKSLIANFSSIRGNDCVKHPLTFRKRLIFAKDSDSDLIMHMNAYRLWFARFGKDIEEQMFRNGHRHIRNLRASDNERRFCEENFLEINSLRETLSNYLDIKHRFLEMKLDPLFLCPNPDLLTLKLCIAAAFCDRYLISSLEISDEKQRNKYKDLLKNSNTSFLLTKIQPNVLDSDISQLLEVNKEPPESISIRNSFAVVSYPENSHIKTLKFAMWLSSYTRRYQNLAWVVVKEWRNDSAISIKPLGHYLSKVPIECRREGTSFTTNTGGKFSKSIEINYIKRLEHPYKLQFKDIITKEHFRIEEDSINSITLCASPELSSCYTLVCTEYSERNKSYMGKNTTLLPLNESLPFILLLIFTPSAVYVADESKKRYAGFKINSSLLIEFPFLFTPSDAICINDFRNLISSFTNTNDYFEESGFSVGIAESIMNLANIQRLPRRHNYPDWSKVVPWEVKPFQGEPEIGYNEGYLPPLKLLQISDSNSYSSEEILMIQTLKNDYVSGLQRLAEILECKEAQLICKICKLSLCPINRIKIVSANPPQFDIKPMYGSLIPVDNVDTDEMVEFVVKNYIVGQWEACNNGHTIGWNDDDGTYISHLAPVGFLLPTLVYLDFIPMLWENNFSELKLKAEECTKNLERMKIDRTCKICTEEFITDDDFVTHVRFNAKHLARQKEFLEIYIN